jgi:hypothetical protein
MDIFMGQQKAAVMLPVPEDMVRDAGRYSEWILLAM